jgi:N-6 DNA Methylase
MTYADSVRKFLSLVRKIETGATARSENDLSANFATCLDALGLFRVLDTSISLGTRKRPDILAYTHQEDADLVLAAEIVIESKKPRELLEFSNIADAVTANSIWKEKTFPYIRENVTRIQYFVLTTFTSWAIVKISSDLRRSFVEWTPENDQSLRKMVQANITAFDLRRSLSTQSQWQQWLKSHFEPVHLAPVPISAIHNVFAIRSRVDLENFADRMAEFAAGADHNSGSGLFASVRTNLPNSYDQLTGATQRDLHIFLMTQHPGMDQAGVEKLAREHPEDIVSEFVASSIHSLIGRLFAFKVIEDKFCVREEEPLIPQKYWIFKTSKYDDKPSDLIREVLFFSLRELRNSGVLAVQRFAEYGFFFDWIENFVDPTLLRSLMEMIASHDFDTLEGDLLGRFFEIYAQKVNRSKRRALGQYYTPQPVVEFLWRIVGDLVTARGVQSTLNVLDPAMGSGTFLTEGARQLAKAGVPDFWDCLTGFDISAQVLGIAYVNLYVSILAELDRNEAADVGDLHVYATDALDPRNGQYLKQILPLIPDPVHKQFIEERIRISAVVKQGGKFTVVIGNPPYRSNSNRTLKQMADVFPDLLESSVANSKAKAAIVRDDYAWFFAAADFYVERSGIIAFIVSDSFAQRQSYRYFRRDLLRRYHIRNVIRLGGQVFQDVGPRIEFVIIVLEKRESVLSSPDETEQHPYVDLRSLLNDSAHNALGTENDPRLQLMHSVACGEQALPIPQMTSPQSALNFSIYPLSPVVDRICRESLPIFEKDQPHIFKSKWPGIKTAFDELLKARTRQSLETRLQAYFELCNRPRLNGTALDAAVRTWGTENGIRDDSQDRLSQLAIRVRQMGLVFDASKIKRALDGGMPNHDRWYPPRRNEVFIYYDTNLRFPRNQNEGKEIGWGSMDQWRPPLSHDIKPKLIYTTAAKEQYGLKAFIVDDEWYVKMAGGTSQQYNYTGISYLAEPPRLDGLPNNLTENGLNLLDRLAEMNIEPSALIYYVASVYNAGIAADFLAQTGGTSPFAIRIPKASQGEIVRGLSDTGLSMRNLFWLLNISEETKYLDAKSVSSFSVDLLQRLGIKEETVQSRKFKSRTQYTVPDDLESRVREQADEFQEAIDRMCEDLYS